MVFTRSFSHVLYFFVPILLLQLAVLASLTNATPLQSLHPSTHRTVVRSEEGSWSIYSRAVEAAVLVRRAKYILQDSPTGELQAITSDGMFQEIPQGPATDGSGKDFDIPAILWIAFCGVVGVPMLLAGIRGWRLSTGVGVGIALTSLSWASICNSIGPSGINDLTIQLIVFGFFLVGFTGGAMRMGTRLGMGLLGVNGGFAFGVRIMLLKPGLLISGEDNFRYVWIVIAALGILNGALTIWMRTQRTALLLGCTSTGSFLVALAADLGINKQSGMSRGLRFLFDRNSSHIIDIISTGYHPPLTTQIILAASLGATFIFAYGQHLLFSQPFVRSLSSAYTDPTLGTGADDGSTDSLEACEEKGAWGSPAENARSTTPTTTRTTRTTTTTTTSTDHHPADHPTDTAPEKEKEQKPPVLPPLPSMY